MPETALLVIDMLNSYDHDDAKPWAGVERHLAEMVSLRDEPSAVRTSCWSTSTTTTTGGMPREALVTRAMNGKRPELVEPIVPTGPVPFLPKGRHSAFYQTALGHLLASKTSSAWC